MKHWQWEILVSGKKCAKRINEIKASGSTIIYVSHHLEEIKNICTRAIFMEDGKISVEGDVSQVCAYYETHLKPKPVPVAATGN